METHMVAHLCGFGWKGFVFRARGHIEIAKWRDSSRFYRDLLGGSYMKADRTLKSPCFSKSGVLMKYIGSSCS